MSEITIKEVVSIKDLKEFVLFPFTLYAKNPYWIPPMIADEMDTFNPKKNPAYKNCETKLWLVHKDGKPAGRIAGIINHSYISKWKNKYARFGWIDFIEDEEVFRLLMNAVEFWAIEKGMTAVHGPLGFTDFDPEGLLVEGFEETGTMSTIYNFNYYGKFLENDGYLKDVDWLEYEITIPEKIPENIEKVAVIAERRYKLHSLKVKHSSELRVYAKNIFNLLNQTYGHLYGVVTLSEAQIDGYIKQYFPFIQHEYVSVVLDEEDKVAAFAIGIPSLSKALRQSKGKLFPFGFLYLLKALKKNKCVDLYLVAVRPNLQGKGVNAILLRDLGNSFIAKNISSAITHPALEENNRVLALWKDFDTRQTKRRRCYLKKLNVRVSQNS